ncbi:hydrogen ion transmembrane transporter [Alternaria burnsii]|uniref:Hydrogen ion transmembrane transporter n=1 Tax=Alternaria burnsii TaxID=1187904 RepID=A0A8H7BMQ1_9PLEO|nr:hydrogen ion transmembrane transporter [Alternaria burnsii]KAF7682307.1 hydrogen ion transmembrane transporter [Alternaria burnsii]
MANGWAPIIGLIVTVIFCGAAWFLAPKGENQTYVHNIPSPKSTPTPTKPSLRTKSSLELPLANPEDRSAGRTVWRSTLVLSAAAMYIMWAITFLAQLHPLISPIRGDLRPEYNGGR